MSEDIIIETSHYDLYLIHSSERVPEMYWDDAIRYCSSLGYSLPTIEDLVLIFENKEILKLQENNQHTIEFISRQYDKRNNSERREYKYFPYVWSSSEWDEYRVWDINMNNGELNKCSRLALNWVIPVRRIYDTTKL